MFTHHFDNLPLCLLQPDPKRPQRSFDQNDPQNPLFRSIRKGGIERPIAVCALDDGHYLILDGLRRFWCAQALAMETVPCQVFTNLNTSERQTVRVILQRASGSWMSGARTASDKRLDELMATQPGEEAE